MGPKMPTALVCYMKEKQPDGDVSSAIRSSLSASLNNGTHNGLNSISNESANLQNQLAATSKLALMSPVDYEEVKSFNNSVQDLKSKYIVLKPQTSTSATATSAAAAATTTATASTFGCNASATITSSSSANTNGKILVNGTSTDKPNSGTASERKGVEFPTPRQILYPRDKVRIGWKGSERKWVPGAGMINVGNTCYLNSTLQALFHVPAFANWLMSDYVHREMCEEKTGVQGGCIICAMAKTLISSQQSGQQAIKPYLVYTKLRQVCKHMVFGQQEDAHEFLRYLMEAMEKAYLARYSRSSQLDQYSKETTPINQILGGYLKTSVRCLACHHESVTFQHFEDLLLDIRKANTLEEALDLYFARERLEDMGYKCESCKKKVSATKQFSLERAPISLCIQLKRFSIVGNKLNKHIAIRQHLNLSKYSSRKNSNESLQYRLVSMVTHLGASQHCGHYTAIGLTDTGSYYQFDDSYVRQISIQNVLNTNAYIIFYELDTSAAAATTAAATSMKATDKLFGPNSMDRISTSADDHLSRSFLDTKELPRNNVTTTVTSGSSSSSSNTTRPFIGPLLPSKSNNGSNDSTASSHSETSAKDSILPNKSHSPKKPEHSPIVKLTSNVARYVTQSSNDTITESSGNKFVQNNGYLTQSNSNCKKEASSSSDDDENDRDDADDDNDENDDDEDDDDDDDDDDDNDASDSDNASSSALNGRHKQHKSVLKRKHSSNNKEQTLPSMPKLEINEAISTSEKNSFKARSLSNGLVKPQNGGTNGKLVRLPQQHDDSDSDSSCDDRTPSIKKNNTTAAKSAAPKSSNSTPILLLNGNNKNRLVPYDDSEYDSGAESPPEVKTKAGPFTVTSTNTNANTPSVVSSFLRKSKTPSPARTINTATLSNGAKLLESQRESDSNMMVKTAASSVNLNKRPNEWHGNEAKNKLMKLNHRGYGGGVVTSWNGQRSAMEKEVNDEKSQELKRQSLSGNDAEMDRGHKKKLGSKLVLSRDNPGYNPFQESQNQRNAWTISNGNSGSNTNGLHRPAYKSQVYRQNPKKLNHHKFNRNSGNGGRHFGNNYRYNNYNRPMNK